MAAQDSLSFEGTFNNTTDGLFDTNTTQAIESVDLRALVTAIKESYANKIDDSIFALITTSGTNTYTGTSIPAITAYSTGQKFEVKFSVASTGASTLNLNTLGAKKIFTNPTTQAGNGDLVLNQIYRLVYDAALDSAAGGFLIVGSSGPSSSGTSIPFGTTSGTNTYTIAATPAVTAYANGNLFLIKVASGSTNLSTFNFDSVGAKKAYATPEEQITDGYLEDNRFYLFSYDSTLDGGAGGFLQVNESNHSVVNMIAGVWDASGGLLPSTTGSGPSGQVKHGDAFIISPGGTVSGTVLSVKDLIIAIVDSPGQTLGNWLLISGLLSTDSKFRATRTVTGASASVQSDDNSLIIFNSGSNFNFTLDQLTATSKLSYVNIGAGQVTFVAGSGVTITGRTVVPAAVNEDYPGGLIFWSTATAVRTITGPDKEPELVSASVSAGTMTLDMDSLYQRKFEDTTLQTGNFTIAFSNTTNAQVFTLSLRINGTIAITLPSTVVMEEGDSRFVNGTKILTLTASTKRYLFSFNKLATSVFHLAATDSIYDS